VVGGAWAGTVLGKIFIWAIHHPILASLLGLHTPQWAIINLASTAGAAAAGFWVMAGVGAVKSFLAQNASQSKGEVKGTPCGEPPWDEATGPNGIRNQLLNPIGIEYKWDNKDIYTIIKPGSFSDFETRLSVNGWEKFSTDPHYKHWGDNDYRKQYKGEWYHISLGRPGKGFNPDIAGPTRIGLHWEEAKPGSLRHFNNFLSSTIFGIPIKYYHPCAPKPVIKTR